jgi:hypothetical protein
MPVAIVDPFVFYLRKGLHEVKCDKRHLGGRFGPPVCDLDTAHLRAAFDAVRGVADDQIGSRESSRKRFSTLFMYTRRSSPNLACASGPMGSGDVVDSVCVFGALRAATWTLRFATSRLNCSDSARCCLHEADGAGSLDGVASDASSSAAASAAAVGALASWARRR